MPTTPANNVPLTDDQSDRPEIRCLMALPGSSLSLCPSAFAVVDIVEVPQWEESGFQFCGVDPDDEQRFRDWRVQHPLAP
jgi:hypothetical protein